VQAKSCLLTVHVKVETWYKEFLMQKIIHRADTRGKFDYGWLKTSHTFSFNQYYDPDRVHFGLLRVLNDDTVESGQGFSTHPHDNMEIVTIPLEGALAHKDSTGHEQVIRANDVQVMSAGTGIWHSEYNASDSENVSLLQIWVFPDQKGHQPRYDQKSFNPTERMNTLQYLVTPDKSDSNLWLNQDAYFSLAKISTGKSLKYALHNRQNGLYIFLIDGGIKIGEDEFSKRDGLGLWDVSDIDILALTKADVLFIEIPMG
jgi:redox-sensitive bicupin YhaK (pirin superfamily)